MFLFLIRHLKAIQGQQHRSPRRPTKEDRHQIWKFPASALTLQLVAMYTLRVTPRTVIIYNAKPKKVTPSLYPKQTNHLVGSFYCNCSGGFTGALCDEEVDECLSFPCMNNGTCIDQVRRKKRFLPGLQILIIN
ncbi:hypothetical protein AVEN_154364-1 [Araneus ventricosus]|uniref:EGF-like domain-containing protein n=1 Tax=Araneus ventricosus TaxID=182803 RepID=A0A4Y2G9R8_ARAVE|nr:hypothetical protein AVEN_85538-1 [Araneus ventricosus]GBM50353.1 hypothetical protein AVEN_154364-1 [Araneus ventricosus]